MFRRADWKVFNQMGLPPRPKDFLHGDGSFVLPSLRALCNYLDCSILEFMTTDGMPREDFEIRLKMAVMKAGYHDLRTFEREFTSKFNLRGDRIFPRMILYIKGTEQYRHNEKERQLRARFEENAESSSVHELGGNPNSPDGPEGGSE